MTRATHAMTVLMTADTVGGVWTYAVDLCRALRAHDVHVHLATMGDAVRPDQLAQLGPLDNVTLHQSTFKLEWMERPWADVARAGEWLLDIERDVHPDVIHLNGYAHGCLPWHTPVLVVAHSCVTSWWQAVKGCAAPAEWDTYRRAVAEGLACADAVVAPSSAMLSALEINYGPLPSARIVHNGRDASPFVPAKKEPFILCAGRLWDEAKNLAALDVIAHRLPWPVYAAGDSGSMKPRGVVPLGRLTESQLAGVMSRAGIYALPARYEPFGLSALEAATSGCALVLGDIPSLREVWANAALYVAPDNHGALAAALGDLIRHPKRREALAARAIERAKRYTPRRMAAGYLEIYRGLRGHDHSPVHHTRPAVLAGTEA